MKNCFLHNKMKRKLIKQGGGGYTIYLPKKWVDKKGLKEGNQVDVQETETSLIIGSPVKGKKEISIEITEENRTNIRNILTHIYRDHKHLFHKLSEGWGTIIPLLY